jgi:hypothetical protein
MIAHRCEGWTDNETLVLNRRVKLRKSDGALYETLDEAERAVLDADPSSVENRTEIFRLKRPAF